MSKKKGSDLLVILLAFVLILFFWVLSMVHSPLDAVRRVVRCQDGTTRSLYVDDPVPSDCVHVDGVGNLVKYDRDSGEAIYVDPSDGKQVEGQK